MRASQRCKTISSCSDIQMNNTPHFPEEIIFSILIWLPADVLYDCMRFVCRQWYDIINSPLFIDEHLQHSSPDFLFKFVRDRVYYLAKLGELSAEVTKTGLPPNIYIHTTCDGLAVVGVRTRMYHVVNVLTKHNIALPPTGDYLNSYSFSIVRSRTLNCYKVVLSYFPSYRSRLEIVSINLNKDRAWTPVKCQDVLAPYYRDRIHALETLAIDGTIYWIVRDGSVVFALDVDSEVLHQFPFPTLDKKEYNALHFMVSGKSLSLLVSLNPRTVLNFWVFTSDFKWRKLYKLDLRGVVSDPIIPVACVSNGEVVVFRNFGSSCASYFAYNLKSGKAFCFGSLDELSYIGYFFDFAYSLVQLPPKLKDVP